MSDIMGRVVLLHTHNIKVNKQITEEWNCCKNKKNMYIKYVCMFLYFDDWCVVILTCASMCIRVIVLFKSEQKQPSWIRWIHYIFFLSIFNAIARKNAKL